jgi:hypothetical protein
MRSATPRAWIVAAIGVLMLSVACSSAPIPSIPELPETGAAPATGGVTLKVTPPQPLSPGEGVEILGSPSLQVSAAAGLYTTENFSYQFEISSASGAVLDTPMVDGTTLVYGGVLPAASTFRWRARAVRDGQFYGPWGNSRSFRTLTIPGCINGLLTDARTFFLWKNNRQLGQPANDWESVMMSVGWPAGYGPGVRPPVGPPFYGLSQQVNTSGIPRGRVFLPTNTPDGNGYYSRETDFLTGPPGALVWDWKEKPDAPAYAPQTCP